MRQPMLRWRMLRHGGHQREEPRRCRDPWRGRRRPDARRAASRSSARSSGRWPMTPGLRSRGCTSMSVRATLMSPQSTSSRPVVVQPRAPIAPAQFRKSSFAVVVLAAVGHVDRGEDDVADLRRARCATPCRRPGWREHGPRSERFLLDVERNPGIRAQAVPEDVVVGELALARDLRGLGLQLLQAENVGPLAAPPTRRAAPRGRGCR